jgi:hypothetical protein
MLIVYEQAKRGHLMSQLPCDPLANRGLIATSIRSVDELLSPLEDLCIDHQQRDPED